MPVMIHSAALHLCPRCKGLGRGYIDVDGGKTCLTCGGSKWIDLASLIVLAYNLALAASLCASFEMGRDAGPGGYVPFKTTWWRPGCGKPWMWPLLTRDDGRSAP